MKAYHKKHIPLARKLRKEMTAEERKLWHLFLKSYPVRFYRQKALGAYIVDFYCARAKLVIEIDGSQHYMDVQPEQDQQRTTFLQTMNLHVIRISNRQIHEEFAAVCKHIHHTVQTTISTPSPKEVSL